MKHLKNFHTELGFSLPINYSDGDFELTAGTEEIPKLEQLILNWTADNTLNEVDNLPVNATLTEWDLLPLGIKHAIYKEPARHPDFQYDEHALYTTFDTVFKYAISEDKNIIGGLAGEILVSGDNVCNEKNYNLNVVLAIEAVQLAPDQQKTGRGQQISECLMFLLHQYLKQLYLSEDMYSMKDIISVNLTLTATPKSINGQRWLERLSENIERKQAQLAHDIGLKEFNYQLCVNFNQNQILNMSM